MPYLALIVSSPWFFALGVMFWLFPRQPRTNARRLFDAVTLLLSIGGSFYGMQWAYQNADNKFGPEWRQIFAALIAAAVYHGMMAIALVARHFLLRPTPAPAGKGSE